MGVKEIKEVKKGWERGKDALVEGVEIGRMFGDRFVRKMKKGKVIARVVAGLMEMCGLLKEKTLRKKKKGKVLERVVAGLMRMLWLVEGKTSAEIEKVGGGGKGSCGIGGKVKDVAGKV